MSGNHPSPELIAAARRNMLGGNKRYLWPVHVFGQSCIAFEDI